MDATSFTYILLPKTPEPIIHSLSIFTLHLDLIFTL